MDAGKTVAFLVFVLFGLSALYQRRACHLGDNQVQLMIDASPKSERKIPDTLFGIFFEEINHAGAGGLWAELVSNRGFEAGGPNTPSNIDPWSIIGTESNIVVSTDRSSCFDRNKVALQMDVLCDGRSSILCPPAGVGVYNPGFWGMNIESGKEYKVSLYVRSLQPINISVSLASSEGSQILASFNVVDDTLPNWTKKEFVLKSQGSNYNSRLQLTTTVKGVIWLDQVSVMPADTYKGHGFRNDLFSMVANMRPRFLRFPGGCFVEGEWLRNAFRWRESIGPWEERPGHFGDVWMYWTDDGLGYFEFLQLSEDLGAAPIWVVNNGISHTDQVATSSILPFVQDTLDSIEFARGDPNSTWGSVRAAMGHPEPFPLKYVAVGNEDCGKTYYRGNYVKFYNAIKNAYPDISIISNCDGSSRPLDHPADLYDFHVYTSANSLFSMSHQFDKAARTGPKAFVSEYAVTGNDAGTGSFLAALAEAGFLIGLETNSDVVGMISYAPLFVNANNRRWNPDAIVFNASHVYGTPSYWVQQFFKDSSGSILHPVALAGNATKSLMASALTWTRPEDGLSFLKIKIVNYGSESIQLVISISGLESVIFQSGSKKTVFTSENLMAENSFQQPNKVVPLPNPLPNAASNMNIIISPKSVTSFDLALAPGVYRSSI